MQLYVVNCTFILWLSYDSYKGSRLYAHWIKPDWVIIVTKIVSVEKIDLCSLYKVMLNMHSIINRFKEKLMVVEIISAIEL